jgi:hypothetical protein
MFSSLAIAFMFAIGFGGWTYSQMSRRVGASNTGSIFTMVIIATVIAFLVVFTLLKFVLGFD